MALSMARSANGRRAMSNAAILVRRTSKGARR
jgi:hypothetical protein